MARINNQNKYPLDKTISNNDFLIGSDKNNTTPTTTLQVIGLIKGNDYTVATLPTGVVGAIAYVTDASVVTYRGIATGGGANTSLVFFDGTNWLYH